jgi:hypothetical protein
MNGSGSTTADASGVHGQPARDKLAISANGKRTMGEKIRSLACSIFVWRKAEANRHNKHAKPKLRLCLTFPFFQNRHSAFFSSSSS